MLSEIRERATGWIAWVIATIIIIPFAFWGVHEYFSGGQEVVVATVDGEEIQQVDYRRALENRRAQLRRMLGESFRPELANSPEFKLGVLDELIARLVLDRHAEEQGYRVGDAQLARAIRANPQFQVDQGFSPEAYRSTVSRMGLTEAGFEAQLRRQIVLEQIRRGIEESAFDTPAQRRRLLSLLMEERRFDYAVLNDDRFVDDITVSDAEVQSEYEEHGDRYRTPEQVKVEYVELSVDELASTVSVTEEEILSAYEQNRDRFTTDPVRRASHILVEVAPDAGEEARQEALNEANDILSRLRDGAEFAELARQYSDDAGSASNGGDLGRIEPGAMVEPFQEALFALEEEGALSEPVKTRFGYHIIKLTEYQPAETKPLSEVREQLIERERTEQAESLFLDRAETFRNVSYEQPRSLEPVADQLGLEIQESDWFSRDQGSGIASNVKVRDAAFGEDVYTDGLNSQAIELDINTFVVVRVLDKQPAALKPLEDVRGQIEARLKQRKAREHVETLGPDLVERMQAGTEWESLMEEHGLEAQGVTRSRSETPENPGAGPDAAVVDEVFRAPVPPGEEPVYGGIGVPGGYAVFRLVEVVDGDPDQAPEELQNRVSESLVRRRGMDMMTQYIADLREEVEVTIREDQL